MDFMRLSYTVLYLWCFKFVNTKAAESCTTPKTILGRTLNLTANQDESGVQITFISPSEMLTYEACVTECCNKQNDVICNVAAFDLSAQALDSTCYLFSCTPIEKCQWKNDSRFNTGIIAKRNIHATKPTPSQPFQNQGIVETTKQYATSLSSTKSVNENTAIATKLATWINIRTTMERKIDSTTKETPSIPKSTPMLIEKLRPSLASGQKTNSTLIYTLVNGKIIPPVTRPPVTTELVYRTTTQTFTYRSSSYIETSATSTAVPWTATQTSTYTTITPAASMNVPRTTVTANPVADIINSSFTTQKKGTLLTSPEANLATTGSTTTMNILTTATSTEHQPSTTTVAASTSSTQSSSTTTINPTSTDVTFPISQRKTIKLQKTNTIHTTLRSKVTSPMKNPVKNTANTTPGATIISSTLLLKNNSIITTAQEEISSRNDTFSTSGESSFVASSGVLITVVTVGLCLFMIIVVLIVQRCYDGYRRREYSKLDYLINGIYN